MYTINIFSKPPKSHVLSMPLFKYHTNVMQNSLYLVKRVSSAKHLTLNLVLRLAKFSMDRYLRTQLPFLSPLRDLESHAAVLLSTMQTTVMTTHNYSVQSIHGLLGHCFYLYLSWISNSILYLNLLLNYKLEIESVFKTGAS